ncbi:hypothetical protein L5515_010662 [Caenorhabditis briggsae]|uniref:Tc1-like transposase DDE domain-containing protein n=1 Tax=Caenorhabditis briggsae TaxID=6238 RepID=A0AAE9JEE3_CAEBR|nr:hypothetical protein L5515_010662 [Caenorhabditis briggsae]
MSITPQRTFPLQPSTQRSHRRLVRPRIVQLRDIGQQLNGKEGYFHHHRLVSTEDDPFPVVTPPSSSESSFELTEDQKQYIRIGQTIAKMNFEALKITKLEKKVKSSGNEIINNVLKSMESIRHLLGHDSELTPFRNPFIEAAAIVGVHENTIRFHVTFGSSLKRCVNILNGEHRDRYEASKLMIGQQARIRKEIHSRWASDKPVSVDEMFEWAKSNAFFNRGRTSFFRAMKALGFRHRKNNNNSVLEEREDIPPTTGTSKQQLIDWLDEHNVPFDRTSKRPVLLAICKEFVNKNGGRSAFVKYELDSWAWQQGVQVLRIPPYHPDFNPIEMAWAQMKTHLRKIGAGSDSLEIVRQRAVHFLETFPASSASLLFEHTKRQETEIRELLLEKDRAVMDESFELVYELDEDGQMVDIHIEEDEDFEEFDIPEMYLSDDDQWSEVADWEEEDTGEVEVDDDGAL